MSQNPNLAVQFSGPVIQAVVNGIQASHDAQLPLLSYWSLLSIVTAQDVDGTLDFVGELVGYPRPLVAADFFTSQFHFGHSSSFPQFSATSGFGSTAVPGEGGVLGSVFPSTSSVIPAGYYQQILPLAAQLRYYGLTLQIIDLLAAWAGQGTGYTIMFLASGDITVTFAATIPYTFYDMLQYLYDLYETAPVVTVINP